jgi:diguanylate cyclase
VLGFVRRVYLLRVLGLALGFVCVAAVLHLIAARPPWWFLLAFYAFVWPHLANAIVVRSRYPQRTELRNLIIDSAMGGLWVAVMEFNLLPSVLLVTMLSVDKVSVGGMALLARTTVVLIAACAATSAALGFGVHIATPTIVIFACIPLLVAYPLAIAMVTHSLRNRVARQNKRLAELGRTDDLTGLGNRRQCFEVVDSELARFRRTARPAALMMIDIDNFKAINDRYGHPVGDEVLCGMASILRESCRAVDTPVRYGGDEFLIVMPETNAADVAALAERIRQRLHAFVFARAPALRCAASLGAAEAGSDMVDADDWIQKADAALYQAKAAGRDCFVGATPLHGVSDRRPAQI